MWSITRRPETGYDQNLSLFRREMDSFFDDFFTLKPSTLFASEWAPSIDVDEDDRSIHVKADMPGMSEKDISVVVENGVLTISGEKKEERKEEKDGKRYIVSERRFGSFRRSISLPDGAKADNIKAEFKNGVLDVEIPKEEKAQPKRIEIKVD